MFCPLSPDWGDLGTWFVGLAAAVIAFYANRISSRSAAEQVTRTAALRRATEALLSPELKSLGIRLDAASFALTNVAKRVNAPDIRRVRQQWLENPMPSCAASFQELGNLNGDLAELIGRIRGLVTTTFPAVLEALDTQWRPDMHDGAGQPLYSADLRQRLGQKVADAAAFARALSRLSEEAWECLRDNRAPKKDIVASVMREVSLH